ncbi:amidohydrolase, partial [Gemmatimonas sp.]|uniref:amidohydrolase family protein n=1 Tax=Gemmatimonas sp. TaxID=1962908 RepID=UPI0035688DE4
RSILMKDTPALSVVDCHVHFWDDELLDYPWLDGIEQLAGRFLPDQVPYLVGNAHVDHIVFVQSECAPQQAKAEVAWVEALAEADPRITGVVAFAALEDPTAQVLLDEYGENPRVKGIRRLLKGEAVGFTASITNGVRSLAGRDLSFDLCIDWHQLGEVMELVDAAPEVQFALDHFGKPPIASGTLDPWSRDLARLAERPNVVAKFSGLITEADHATWRPADLKPYVDHAFSVFGVERVLFGSDWPPLTLASSYDEWLQVSRSIINLSVAEERAVFRTNAQSFYRLPATESSTGPAR